MDKRQRVKELRAEAVRLQTEANELEDSEIGWWLYYAPSGTYRTWQPSIFLGKDPEINGASIGNSHYATGKGGCVVIWADGTEFKR